MFSNAPRLQISLILSGVNIQQIDGFLFSYQVAKIVIKRLRNKKNVAHFGFNNRLYNRYATLHIIKFSLFGSVVPMMDSINDDTMTIFNFCEFYFFIFF